MYIAVTAIILEDVTHLFSTLHQEYQMLSCVKLKIGPQFQMCTDARQQPVSGYESQMLFSDFCIRTCFVG